MPGSLGRGDGSASRTVVYVAGHARSGSTIIDMHLAGLAGVTSLGEFTHFPGWAAAGHPCTCGAPLSRCTAWATTWRQTEAFGLQRAAVVTRGVEQGSIRGRLGLTPPVIGQYEYLWSRLFAAAATDRGTPVLVDSSKSLYFTRYRLASLLAAGIDLRVLHVTRDPRAVAFSNLQGPGAQFGHQRARWRALVRSAAAWRASNVVVERIARGGVPYARLRYEDYAAAPAATLAAALHGLGLGELADTVPDTVRRVADHAVGGNEHRYRRDPDGSSEVAVRPDLRWHTGLTSLERVLAYAPNGRAASRYGYARTDGEQAA